MIITVYTADPRASGPSRARGIARARLGPEARGSAVYDKVIHMARPQDHQCASVICTRRRAPRPALCVRMAVADVNVLEKMAVAASEAWDTTVTNFLDQELVAATEQRLEGQDVGVVKVGGYAGASRSRFVFTNPELLDTLDEAGLATEHAVLLRISAAFDKKGNRFGAGGKLLPNLLDGIGIDFEQLGDVSFDEGKGGQGGVAYIVCDASVQKTIARLLPKSLGRASVEVIEPGDDSMPTGTLVEMIVARVDKRD